MSEDSFETKLSLISERRPKMQRLSRRLTFVLVCVLPLICLQFGCGKKEEASSGTYYEGKKFTRPGSGGNTAAKGKSDNS